MEGYLEIQYDDRRLPTAVVNASVTSTKPVRIPTDESDYGCESKKCKIVKKSSSKEPKNT